jgi:hypothetical protein
MTTSLQASIYPPGKASTFQKVKRGRVSGVRTFSITELENRLHENKRKIANEKQDC